MIDEKKLIEKIKTESKIGGWLYTDEIIDIINSQPKIEKCADCSKRKFYQQGYEAAKNAFTKGE